MPFGTETLLVLFFGLKLVKVPTERWYPLTDLLNDILQSKDYDLPQEVRDIMQSWKPRQLRYHTLRRPLPINDLNDIPTEFGEDNLIQVPAEGYSTDCTFRRIPDDGSCLNMIVDQPPSIEKLQGEERFRSREVILYLRQFEVELRPIGYSVRIVSPGRMQEKTPVCCKLGTEQEARTFDRLEKYGPGSHNVAAQLIPSHRLPTGDYLITMGMYGDHLVEVMQGKPRLLAGPLVLKMAQQLCTAIAFLHSHNRFHLDIKPENIVVNTAKDCDFTVVDLGGTYHYAPPEVRLWFEYEEEERKQAKGPADRPPPSSYFPRKAD
ncbi:hypothetical protein V5O48_012173, partial [Marasmius crinis-equi]